MNVSDLRIILEELESILSAANAKGQSRDIAKFLKLLDDHDGQSVDEFLRHLKARLAAKPTSTERRSEKPDKQLVEEYLVLLQDADIDKRIFSSIFKRLTKDKNVSKVDADAIAHCYRGAHEDGRKGYASRKAALQSISEWFEHIAYQRVKLSA